jgi:polyhydroxyalkanoate synthesis regulator phasin
MDTNHVETIESLKRALLQVIDASEVAFSMFKLSDAEVTRLRERIEALNDRIAELEAEPTPV